jgi:hypothetical protein
VLSPSSPRYLTWMDNIQENVKNKLKLSNTAAANFPQGGEGGRKNSTHHNIGTYACPNSE